MTFMDDTELAAHLAHLAGAALLKLQQSGTLSGVELGNSGDALANRILIDGLRHHRPDDAILSEEEADNHNRLNFARVWIIDPLDGTSEYANNTADWAVHVGLAIDGMASIGAVSIPAFDRHYNSSAVPKSTPYVTGKKPCMVVSRSRCPGLAHKVAAILGADIVAMGSAGVKAMAVVDGSADIYLHAGGQYEWDNCAPVAIAKAAGLSATQLDGTMLHYNKHRPYTPDLLICNSDMRDAALNAIAAAVAATAEHQDADCTSGSAS